MIFYAATPLTEGAIKFPNKICSFHAEIRGGKITYRALANQYFFQNPMYAPKPVVQERQIGTAN